MSCRTVGVFVSLSLVPICALSFAYCGKSGGGGGTPGQVIDAPPAGTLALSGLNGTIPKDGGR
jgi:hypothetical protein